MIDKILNKFNSWRANGTTCERCPTCQTFSACWKHDWYWFWFKVVILPYLVSVLSPILSLTLFSSPAGSFSPLCLCVICDMKLISRDSQWNPAWPLCPLWVAAWSKWYSERLWLLKPPQQSGQADCVTNIPGHFLESLEAMSLLVCPAANVLLCACSYVSFKIFYTQYTNKKHSSSYCLKVKLKYVMRTQGSSLPRTLPRRTHLLISDCLVFE